MEPVLNDFATKYTDVEFVKIDVDELDVWITYHHIAFLYTHRVEFLYGHSTNCYYLKTVTFFVDKNWESRKKGDHILGDHNC